MNAIDEQQLDAYLETWVARRLGRRLWPWFRGTVVNVIGQTPPYQVLITRTGETDPTGAPITDGLPYTVLQPGYVPQLGDVVDCTWRDDFTGYAVVPLSGPGAVAAGKPGWKHWSRYVVGTGGSVDTGSNPGGDIPLPSGYRHAWVIVSDATDTGTGTTGNFGGLQIAVAGGAIDTAANYIWTDKDVFTTTAGVTNEGITGSPNGQDSSWGSFVLTGGGTGPNWPGSANIYLPGYSISTNHATAFWDILQINNSTVVRRMGAGYYAGSVGVITTLHFFARVNHLAAGTTFDLLVMA